MVYNLGMVIQKDPQNIGLMAEFVRTKRRLSQQEVAKEAGINRALISLVESGKIEKSGTRPIKAVLKALHIHERSLDDLSLFQHIKSMKDSAIYPRLQVIHGDKTDVILKVYSAAFDAYCSILPWHVNWEIAKKSARHYNTLISSPGVKEALKLKSRISQKTESGQPATSIVNIDILDYLPTAFIYDILGSLSERDLSDIFSSSGTPYGIADSSELERNIFKDILTNDPFEKFMGKIGIGYFDYFKAIDCLVETAAELRKASFDGFAEEALHVIQNIKNMRLTAMSGRGK